MRGNVNIWVPIVVIVALTAGLVAFLLATPNEARRVSSGQVGFGQLHRERVVAAARGAEAWHRGRFVAAATARGATANGRAWLDALAGSRTHPRSMPRTVRVGPTTAAARARVNRFVRWADDLPVSAWSVELEPAAPPATEAAPAVDATPATDATPAVAAGSSPVRTVAATVQVGVAQAVTGTRRQTVPVEVDLAPVGGTAAAPPRSWRVVDVRVGGEDTFLRGYADPVVVHRAAVDVVAPRAALARATAIADAAQPELVALRTRLSGIDGADRATIWLLDDADDAGALLGRDAPASALGSSRSVPHAVAWSDERGEIAVSLPRLAQLTPAQQTLELRHQLAHVAALGLVGGASPMLVEGVATAESTRDAAPPAVDLRPLDAAFTRGDSALARLLVADPGTPLDAADAAGTRQAALDGYATAAWIEDAFGRERLRNLLVQLDDEVPVERALRNVLKRTPEQVEQQVAAWTRRELAAAASPTAEAGTGAPTAATDPVAVTPER